jgi:hypothetical protein
MQRSLHPWLASCLLLAIVVAGYTWAWHGQPAYDGDSPGYLAAAVDLQDGTVDRLHARTLGYPLFLALTGSAPTPGATLVLLQLLCHAVAVAGMVLLLRRLRAGGRAIAVFVAVALLPPFVEHALFVLSESLSQLLVVLGLVGVASWLLGAGAAWLAAGAVSLALVGLVHPSNQLLWLAVPLLAVAFQLAIPAGVRVWRRTAIASVALAATAALALGSMIAWNAARFDFVGISPMLGATLSHKTVRVLERLPDEYAPVREILIRHRDAALLDPESQHLGLAYIFRATPELEAATGLRGPALSSFLVRMNLALIRRAPMDYVDEVLRSAVWYWAPGVTDHSGFGSDALKAVFNGLRAAVLAAFGATVLLLAGPSLLFVAAIRRRAGSDRDEATGRLLERLLVLWLLCGAIGYSSLINTTLTAAVYRLRIPFDLPILAVACLGHGTWSRLRTSLERLARAGA